MGNAGYRQIHPELWDDPFILDLNPDEKLLFIYMFSNSRSSLCGLYEISIKQIIFHTGLEEKYILSTLKKFEHADKIVCDENIYFVVNQFKRHFSKSPKVIERVNNDIESTRDCKPKTVCIQKYEELYGYGYPIHIVSGKAVYSMDTQTYKIREDNIKENNITNQTKAQIAIHKSIEKYFVNEVNLIKSPGKSVSDEWTDGIADILAITNFDEQRTKELIDTVAKYSDKDGLTMATPKSFVKMIGSEIGREARSKNKIPAGKEFKPEDIL